MKSLYFICFILFFIQLLPCTLCVPGIITKFVKEWINSWKDIYYDRNPFLPDLIGSTAYERYENYQIVTNKKSLKKEAESVWANKIGGFYGNLEEWKENLPFTIVKTPQHGHCLTYSLYISYISTTDEGYYADSTYFPNRLPYFNLMKFKKKIRNFYMKHGASEPIDINKKDFRTYLNNFSQKQIYEYVTTEFWGNNDIIRLAAAALQKPIWIIILDDFQDSGSIVSFEKIILSTNIDIITNKPYQTAIRYYPETVLSKEMIWEDLKRNKPLVIISYDNQHFNGVVWKKE